MKLWDLSTQHCIQTVVAHRAEVWSLDLNPEQDLIFTGSNEGDLKIWKLDHSILQDGLKETADGQVSFACAYTVACILMFLRSRKPYSPQLRFLSRPAIASARSLFIPRFHISPYKVRIVLSKSFVSAQRKRYAKSRLVARNGLRRRARKSKTKNPSSTWLTCLRHTSLSARRARFALSPSQTGVPKRRAGHR